MSEAGKETCAMPELGVALRPTCSQHGAERAHASPIAVW
jgi:hypothetical protein